MKKDSFFPNKKENKRHSSSFLLYLFLLLSSILIIAWLIEALNTLKFPLSNDSYFEDAKNFLSGRGIVRTPWSIDQINSDYAPTEYQPPGYAILIAFISFFGLLVIDTDLWVSRISYMLLLPIITFSLRPLIGTTASIFCGLLAITTPSLYLHGSGPYTEPVFALLLILSIGLVISSIQPNESQSKVKRLLCAGILASAAYSIRNAGIAYYLSLYSALIIASLLHILKTRTAFLTFFYFTIGSLPILIALFWRNISLFDQIIPYRIDQGYFATLITSLRVFLEASIFDFSASSNFAKQLAWDIKLLVILGIPSIILFLFILWKRWRTYTSYVQFFIIFSFLSFLSTGSMLIIAHSFHGLDPGNLIRHVIPVTWLIFPLVTIVIGNTPTFLWRTWAVILFGLTLFFAHIKFIQEDIHNSYQVIRALEKSNDVVLDAQPLLNKHKIITSQINLKLAEDREIRNSINAIPHNAMIVSNAGGLLRRLTGRSIRSIDFSANKLEKTMSEFEKMAVQVGDSRIFYVVIVPSNDIARLNNAVQWKEKIIEKFPEEFTLTIRKENIIVLKKS